MTVRTAEMADTLVQGLSEGTPLRALCRTHGISKSEVYRWIEDDANFAGRIARAREEGFDEIALDALDILDEEPERVVTTTGEDRTETRIDSASVQRAKNRFEGRMKLLSKWDPKRYGEKSEVKQTHALDEETAAWLGMKS